MEKLQKSFEIAVPVRAAYNQWTQFEEFPRFMDGVKEVRQIDDTHVHWHASVAGVDKEWDAEITEQVPDKVIAWHSTTGPRNAGEVRFEPLDRDRTRVQLTMEYETDGTLEKVGDTLGFTSRQLDRTVDGFREFLESRGRETGSWRGEVHDGEEASGSEVNPPAPLSSREWQVAPDAPPRGN